MRQGCRRSIALFTPRAVVCSSNTHRVRKRDVGDRLDDTLRATCCPNRPSLTQTWSRPTPAPVSADIFCSKLAQLRSRYRVDQGSDSPPRVGRSRPKFGQIGQIRTDLGAECCGFRGRSGIGTIRPGIETHMARNWAELLPILHSSRNRPNFSRVLSKLSRPARVGVGSGRILAMSSGAPRRRPLPCGRSIASGP